MPLKPTDLQAGALDAWSPLQQAALYRTQAAEQAARDEKQEEEDERKKAKEEADKKKGKKPDAAPETVQASDVLQAFIKWLSPELLEFLDLFGPPHLVFAILLGLHVAFWLLAPVYVHSLLAWPAVYIIPGVQTHRTLFSKTHRGNRPMWQAYWAVLAVLEYAELCLFGEHSRGLIFWPLTKTTFCLWMYSTIGGEPGKKQTMASIRLLSSFLPDLPEEKKDEAKAGDKKDGDKASGSSSSKQRSSSGK